MKRTQSGIAVLNMRNRTYQIIYLVLMTLLIAFGIQGFEHGRVNNFSDQSIQLPIIYSYADSSLFTDDFLIQVRESYVTLFYPALGIISRVVPLEAAMLVLYTLAIGITVSGVHALGETLFPNRNVGLFAVVLWMAYLPNLGGDYIHSPFVTHSTFAIAMSLWALVLIFRRHYTAAALLLGFIANINAMTSTFVTFMWMFAIVTNPREWSWRLVRIPILMGITALPILVWRLSLPLVEASLDDFVAIVRLRLWYAVFPFSVSTILWVGTLALLGLWVYSFRYGKPTQHPMIWRMATAIGLLCLAGTVFSELIPVEFIIELQLIRSAWLVNLLIILYLANMLRTLLDSRNPVELGAAFSLILILAAPRWVIEVTPIKHPTPYELFADFDVPLIGKHPLVFTGLLILVIAGLLYAIQQITQRPKASSRVLYAWFGLAVACFALPAFQTTYIPDEQAENSADWEDTLYWVEGHTPKDAVFVAPPTFDGFRTIAKRSHIGDWKDGTVGIFNNGWAIEWRDLMMDLGFNEDEFEFEPLTTEQLCGVVFSYDVDYAVVIQEWDIAGESVYENETFAVVPADNLRCGLDVAADQQDTP